MPATIQLPPEIEAQRLAGDEVRYLLPKRQLGRLRVLGLMAIAFGVGMFAAVLLFWWYSLAGQRQPAVGALGLLVHLVISLPGLALSCALIGTGLAIRSGRSEIELRKGTLHCRERVGAFRWTRRLTTANIRRFYVKSERQAFGGPSLEIFVLKAEFARGKDAWLAVAYPHDWLVGLGQQLATDCAASMAVQSIDGPAPIEVVDVPAEESADLDRPQQPAGSNVVYQPLPDGLTLSVPPSGIRHGSAGLFTSSLIVCGFMSLCTIIWVVSIVQKQGRAPNADLSGVAVFLLFFWAIGAGMMLGAVNMGRRRAALAVAGGALMVIQTGIFGTKRRQWQQQEVKTVRAAPSGAEVNGKALMQLQIVPREGKPFGVLTGRELAELQWIATLLRRALFPTADVAI